MNFIHSRNERQNTVHDWCRRSFGVDHASSVPQRAIRFFEEAVELFQACGCDELMAHKVVETMFARPAGKVEQEFGGVGVTILALAEACGLSAEIAEMIEVDRVLAIPPEVFRKRNEDKNKMGLVAPELAGAYSTKEP